MKCKMKKILVTIICLLGSIITCYPTFGISDENALSERQSLYLVINGGYRYGKFGHQNPNTAIYKLSFSKTGNHLIPVQVFDAMSTEDIRYYYEHRLLTISTDEGKELNIISMDTPWQKQVYKKVFDFLFPVTYKGKSWLASCIINLKNEKAEIKLINPATLIEVPESINLIDQIDTGVNLATKERLEFETLGLRGRAFPYTPPRNLLNNNYEWVSLVCNSSKYVVLKGLNKIEKITEIIYFNKQTNKWSKQVLPGDRNQIKIFDNFLISWIGYKSSQIDLPPELTGEICFLNLENNQKYSIKKEATKYIAKSYPMIDILLMTNDYLIAVNQEDATLIHVRIINGKVDLNNATILYKDQNNNDEETPSMVSFIRGAFFGPREIPSQN